MNDHLSAVAIQELLDGELSPVECVRAQAHLAHCSECANRQARLSALFTRLAALPEFTPDAALEDRIVAAVLPGLRERAARRARVWRFLGGAYAAGTAASLVAVASLVLLPAPRAWAHDVAGAGTQALAGAFVFVCRSINAGVLRLATGASLWHAASERVSPFARALAREC